MLLTELQHGMSAHELALVKSIVATWLPTREICPGGWTWWTGPVHRQNFSGTFRPAVCPFRVHDAALIHQGAVVLIQRQITPPPI
jgi:hypothetical protein